MNKHRILLIFSFLFLFGFSNAGEGLWIPKLIKQQEGKMKSLGMELSAEEIYDEENPSLKDAVLHFGGGCTGEIISDQGLVLTNHHCGDSYIQKHSSLENNYLKNGFWASSFEEELPNPGLTVTRYVSMKEVTKEVLEDINSKMSDTEKITKLAENIDRIGQAAVEGTHYNYIVKPFYEGNQFYLIVTEVFKDVRLVGAPPTAVGNFGADIDNWIWPRHTGDFSIFRVYADKDNKPAEYSEENVPYKPIRSLTISTKGIKPGDFTMVYGFPGGTYEYLYSGKLDLIINKSLPLAIEMRGNNLEIIDRAMRSSELIDIQYTSKQSRISNAWKKYIGQTKGLKRFDAVNKKKQLEKKFSTALEKDKKLRKMYSDLFSSFDEILPEYEKYYLAYTLWREFVYYGPEFIRFINGLEKTLESQDSVDVKKEKLISKIDNFYKNYVPGIDRDVLRASWHTFFSNLDTLVINTGLRPYIDLYENDPSVFVTDIFDASVFTDEKRIRAWAEAYQGENDAMLNDPAYAFTQVVYDLYYEKIRDDYQLVSSKLDLLERDYMMAQMKVLPEEKEYYPNGNSTLRVAYGQVGGYEPRDAIKYEYQTSTEGILEKYEPGSYEFDLPEELRSLLINKDFGVYSEGDKLPVCFIAGNHTTGGNSGSPVFNGRGELIGINFDRTWESTMSDMMFNPEICRNISVDIRYVLFIIDKYAGAERLIEEMDIN